MSKTLVHAEDDTVLFTATTTARVSGDPVLMGTAGAGGMVGILKVDVAATKTGAAFRGGVHTISKQTNVQWKVGNKVFFNGMATKKFSLTSTSNTRCGRVFENATTAAATGKVVLNAL